MIKRRIPSFHCHYQQILLFDNCMLQMLLCSGAVVLLTTAMAATPTMH